MNSFYGGKQGLTYNIVQRFPSVKDMVEAFKNGGAYSKVNYGQYVLIDTISTRQNYVDKENGLLFRRGFDYQKGYVDPTTVENWEGWTATTWEQWLNDGVGGGAIYVGQISGPMGKSPTIKLQEYNSGTHTLVENINNIFKEATTASLSDQVHIGYTTEEEEINGATERVAKVGLQIPFPNIKFSATTVTANSSTAMHKRYDDNNIIRWQPLDGNFSHVFYSQENEGLYKDIQIAIPVSGFEIKDIEKSNNKTTFKIESTIPKYTKDENNNDIVVPIYSQDIELLAQSVSELKLEGDYLYYKQALPENNNKWIPLGIPSGQFHVYTYFSANDKETALNELNQVLPFGIDDGDVRPVQYTIGPHAGWIVGIKFTEQNEETHLQEEKIELYAFDYTTPIDSIPNTSAWFKIADFSTSLISPDTVIIVDYPQEDNPNIPANYNYSLNPVLDGIWLLKQNLPADAEDWSEV